MDRENIDAKENFALTQSEAKYELADQINTMLQEWHPDLITTTVQTVSFTQMSTLGAAIAELVPAFRTATQSVSTNASGLYHDSCASGQKRYHCSAAISQHRSDLAGHVRRSGSVYRRGNGKRFEQLSYSEI